MKLLFPLTATVALALVGTAGRGQERNEDECLRLRPSIQSPVEMAACTFDIDGSNDSLRSAYEDLSARVRPEYRRSLKQAQKAWIAYRDAQCAYEARDHPGTMGSSDVIACTAKMNRARAKYLRDDR